MACGVAGKRLAINGTAKSSTFVDQELIIQRQKRTVSKCKFAAGYSILRKSMIHRFDRFSLDEDRFELFDENGEAVPLQARPLELLILLLRNAGSLVTKEEILREVWGGLYTSRSSIATQVGKLRAALDDLEAPHRLVETVRGKGVKLIAEVTREVEDASLMVEPEAKDFAETGEASGLRSTMVGDQPSIAVMPFVQPNEGDQLESLTKALPMDIITALSRFQLVRVTARASSFLLDEPGFSPLTAKSVLGCDYCLTGAVTRAGDNYSIYTELVDTSNQAIIWAEQFEAEPRDIHSVRAEIVSRVVSRVEDKVPQNEAKQLQFSQPESLTAWQAFHVGTSLIYRRGDANIRLAQNYLERAVGIDPGFSRAWAGLAHTFSFEVINRPFDTSKSAKRSLMKFAERAVDTNPDDPSANLWLGRAMSMTEAEGDAAIWIERAIEIAPSYALAHQQMATTQAYQNNHSLALDHASTSLKLNPHGPERYANYSVIALAQFKSGDFISSIEWSKKAGKVPYNNLHIMLAGLCNAHWTGDIKEATRLANRIKDAFPGTTQDQIFNLNQLAGQFRNMASGVLTAHGIK